MTTSRRQAARTRPVRAIVAATVPVTVDSFQRELIASFGMGASRSPSWPPREHVSAESPTTSGLARGGPDHAGPLARRGRNGSRAMGMAAGPAAPGLGCVATPKASLRDAGGARDRGPSPARLGRWFRLEGEYGWRRTLLAAMERITTASATAVVANSPSLANRYRELRLVDPANLFVTEPAATESTAGDFAPRDADPARRPPARARRRPPRHRLRRSAYARQGDRRPHRGRRYAGGHRGVPAAAGRPRGRVRPGALYLLFFRAGWSRSSRSARSPMRAPTSRAWTSISCPLHAAPGLPQRRPRASSAYGIPPPSRLGRTPAPSTASNTKSTGSSSTLTLRFRRRPRSRGAVDPVLARRLGSAARWAVAGLASSAPRRWCARTCDLRSLALSLRISEIGGEPMAVIGTLCGCRRLLYLLRVSASRSGRLPADVAPSPARSNWRSSRLLQRCGSLVAFPGLVDREQDACAERKPREGPAVRPQYCPERRRFDIDGLGAGVRPRPPPPRVLGLLPCIFFALLVLLPLLGSCSAVTTCARCTAWSFGGTAVGPRGGRHPVWRQTRVGLFFLTIVGHGLYGLGQRSIGWASCPHTGLELLRPRGISAVNRSMTRLGAARTAALACSSIPMPTVCGASSPSSSRLVSARYAACPAVSPRAAASGLQSRTAWLALGDLGVAYALNSSVRLASPVPASCLGGAGPLGRRVVAHRSARPLDRRGRAESAHERDRRRHAGLQRRREPSWSLRRLGQSRALRNPVHRRHPRPPPTGLRRLHRQPAVDLLPGRGSAARRGLRPCPRLTDPRAEEAHP